ncbi:MAG: secretion protein HlyD [Gammaproteobacteria bacterium SG8_11]|nr:MAG: secretion protein HlyD [Gammaproteobacteria bacterium SG8_11]
MSKLPITKHPGIAIVTVLIALLLIWGFWPRPIMVEAVKVDRAPMTVTIEEEGQTRVIDRYVISAPVDGVACRVQFDVGDSVNKDQVLLNISPLASQILDPRARALAEARVAAAKAALESARQQAESAKATAEFYNGEIKRLRPLAAQGVISKDALDKAEMEMLTGEAALRSANHQVRVAEYNLQAAQTALEYTTGTDSNQPAVRVPVRSPITGKVLKLPRECEGPVRTGESLLEVGDPAQLEIVVDVLSADAVKIKPGVNVLFERWGGEQPLEGRVRTIEPVGFTKISALGVEEQRVNVIADITSPSQEWQRLGDGYRVEARFILWHEEDVLQVPASSLFRYDKGWAVFVVENDRAKRRVVRVGQRNGLVAQMLEGIIDGEYVINHPSDEVEDGKRIIEH